MEIVLVTGRSAPPEYRKDHLADRADGCGSDGCSRNPVVQPIEPTGLSAGRLALIPAGRHGGRNSRPVSTPENQRRLRQSMKTRRRIRQFSFAMGLVTVFG
jgi:hypothetical protein